MEAIVNELKITNKQLDDMLKTVNVSKKLLDVENADISKKYNQLLINFNNDISKIANNSNAN